MTNEKRKATFPKADELIDGPLRQRLEEIEREETPERLLVLAKELQRLLRESGS